MGKGSGHGSRVSGLVVTQAQYRTEGLQIEPAATPAVEIANLSRSFGSKRVLRGVSMTLAPGEIHALLGPNGAGKTTLLRILVGLVEPEQGEVRVLGLPWRRLAERESRRLFGVIPASDRSFYYRLSALENLVFFGRLFGLDLRTARRRAQTVLEQVGLLAEARQRVGTYSHGMQKRLGIARALLMEPMVLLVDEATHDLDPQGSERIRVLIRQAAARGAGVLWTTQRVEEIRGFADRVTLLHDGQVRFSGSVHTLRSMSDGRSYLLELEDSDESESADLSRLQNALVGLASVGADGSPGHFAIELPEGTDLGEVLNRLHHEGLRLRGISEQRSEIERAFLRLTGGHV